MKNKCDLIISKNYLKVKGEEIPCYMTSSSHPLCCRVALVENVSVPPESEIIVSGKPLDSFDRSTPGVVEPAMKFVQNTGLLVAKVLVDTKNGNIPMRLANLSRDSVHVNKGTVTALLRPISSIGSESWCSSDSSESVQPELPEHMVQLFERSSANLDTQQKARLCQFLIKHQDIFFQNLPVIFAIPQCRNIILIPRMLNQ